MHIVVLSNLPGTSSTSDIVEADEDTRKSALNIADTLKSMGHTCDHKEINFSDIPDLKNLHCDLVFNLVEWSGRESKYGVKVIEALDAAGIKYSGSHPWGYKLSCDKLLMKQRMNEVHIPTPLWSTEVDAKFNFPVIVKPVYEHCGIGISQKSVVSNAEDLNVLAAELKSKYDEPVIIEEYIPGMEAHVTILEKDGKPWVLPPAVLRFDNKEGYWPVLTYESKWANNWETKMSTWINPSELSDKVRQSIETVALQCYRDLGGRSYSRVDMRISDTQVYALEINNNPGIDFDPESGIAVSAKLAGLDWPGLLKNIINESLVVP